MKFSTFTKYLFIFFALTANISHAETNNVKNSKAALLKAWEQNQKSQPTTIRFEKTKDNSIYNFETTLFPYKGKVVVHNVLIHEDIEYYGAYEARESAEIVGIIEAELIDAPERFTNTLYESIGVWQKQNKMLFFNDTQKWMTASQWREESQWKEITGTAQSSDNQCGYNSSITKKNKKYTEIFLNFLPLLLLLVFFVFLMKNTKKCQQSHTEKIDLSLERQQEALDLQKEQNQLLKQILSKKE